MPETRPSTTSDDARSPCERIEIPPDDRVIDAVIDIVLEGLRV